MTKKYKYFLASNEDDALEIERFIIAKFRYRDQQAIYVPQKDDLESINKYPKISSNIEAISIETAIDDSEGFILNMNNPNFEVLWEFGYWLGSRNELGLNSLVVLNDQSDLINKSINLILRNPFRINVDSSSEEIKLINTHTDLFENESLNPCKLLIELGRHPENEIILLGYLRGIGLDPSVVFIKCSDKIELPSVIINNVGNIYYIDPNKLYYSINRLI